MNEVRKMSLGKGRTGKALSIRAVLRTNCDQSTQYCRRGNSESVVLGTRGWQGMREDGSGTGERGSALLK